MALDRNILALAIGFVYILSSASETLAIKSFNYSPIPVVLPAYTAFMSNQLWVLLLPIYLRQPMKMKMNYLKMGLLTFIITLLRSISINSLPGSVFGLLISTSIVFNLILSVFWLNRQFNRWHSLAAGLCICSAASILSTVQLDSGNYSLGVPSALLAAFFIAFMSVWQEKLENQLEMTLVASFIAMILTLVYAVFSREIRIWSPSLEGGGALIICVSIALPVLKLLVRNSKYSVIQYSSAFFFEFIQASSSLLGSAANILVFGEPWNDGYSAAFVLMAASFGAYIYAKRKIKKPTAEPVIVVSPWK